MTGLRETLPALPRRMERLPVDARGYPVPWFVKWFDDKPDFRIIDAEKFRQAIRFGNCWICGELTGVKKTFVVGPMATINRITAEPACHFDCAEFAAMACPFLILPFAQRREANIPEGVSEPPGTLNPRNPGVVALWTTRNFKIIKMPGGQRLIGLSNPISVYWFAQGREATRDEVLESIQDGLPVLYEAAHAESQDAVLLLENQYARMQVFLPK